MNRSPNVFKWLVKYFFYPRIIIADPKWNLLCFMAFIMSFALIPDPYCIYYICFFLIYLIVGQNLPKKWFREFYDIEGIG